MIALENFVGRVLRLLPQALWWVLALLVGAIVSIQLKAELWPHTPEAEVVARWVCLACLVALPVLGIVWLWRVAWQVVHPGWRLLWQLAAAGTTAMILGLLLLLAFIAILAR